MLQVSCLPPKAFPIPINENSKNVWGIPHGAIIFAIADVASGVAVHNASGKSTKTISSNLNFLDNYTDIKKLTAYGEVTRLGKSIGYTSVIVKDEKDRLIAQGQYVMKVFSTDVYKK